MPRPLDTAALRRELHLLLQARHFAHDDAVEELPDYAGRGRSRGSGIPEGERPGAGRSTEGRP